ncbi:hypothetical protein INT47_006499 [Mucor saturninus]|uniref:HMG box domain-containing protein n=1 Tax=Mucor saturninus TaxID=64648 RepID=A0A8H7QR36_9FUNG|nr:hypothetical protein INT47_006499 [Mucor saturninus]
MSFIKSFSNLVLTRSLSTRSLHPKKFVSILENVPIKPRNPWQIYLRENINNYKNENGKVELKVATRLMGDKWKALDETEKARCKKIYEQEVEAHNIKKNEALKNATPQQFFEENRLRRKYKLNLIKDPSQPKRPMNSFMYFLQHLRETKDPVMKRGDVKEQATSASDLYKALSEAEKAVRHIINDKQDNVLICLQMIK